MLRQWLLLLQVVSSLTNLLWLALLELMQVLSQEAQLLQLPAWEVAVAIVTAESTRALTAVVAKRAY